jgi:CelD/BcsL family acetyltransferase involved in cellulose biosynthesis
MTTATTERSATGVRLETFTSFDDAEALAPEWDELVARLDGSLYMSFSWCRVWWDHYGDGRALRLLAVREHDELVGVLPFFVERMGAVLGRARVAKLVGSDFTLATVDPPVQSGAATEALALAMTQLFRDDRCHLVHYGPCSEDAPLEAIRESVAVLAGEARIIRDRESDSQTIFEMPDGFDAYLKSLTSKVRSNYKRNLKKLGEAFNFSYDVVADPATLEHEFEAFIEMHQAQWKANKKLGHFDDWPGSREFARDLVKDLARTNQVRLIRLSANDQVVSYCFCFRLNDTFYWRLSGRLSGEWDQFGVGRIAVMNMMEAAASEGATAVEAGTGRYEYKEKLQAKTLPVRSISVRRRGVASASLARATLALGDLLHLAYYRIWFQRVAPRLGFLRGPLWRSWIRRRF